LSTRTIRGKIKSLPGPIDLLSENSLDSLPCSPPPPPVVVAVEAVDARLLVDCPMPLQTFSMLWLGLDVFEVVGDVISACWLDPLFIDHEDFESLNLSLRERVLMKVERRPESGWWCMRSPLLTSCGLYEKEEEEGVRYDFQIMIREKSKPISKVILSFSLPLAILYVFEKWSLPLYPKSKHDKRKK
jgi:hypothetical protein